MHQLIVKNGSIDDYILNIVNVILNKNLSYVLENPVRLSAVLGVGDSVAKQRVSAAYDYQSIAPDGDGRLINIIGAEVM